MKQILLIYAISVVSIAAQPADAQVNPFDPTNPVRTPRLPSLRSPSSGESRRARDLLNPITIEIRKRATQGPGGLGEAIAKFSQISRVDLVAELLQQLVNRNLSTADAAEIASRIGDPTLFDLRFSQELTAEQKSVVAGLQQAAAEFARDPARLKSFMPALIARDEQTRSAAEQALARGGQAAIAVLVEELMSGTAGLPVPVVAEQLRRHGDSAIEAVQLGTHQVAGTSRNVLLEALTRISPTQAVPSLLSAAYARDTDAATRAMATQLLKRMYPQLPELETAHQHLAVILERTINDWRHTPAGGEAIKGVWSISNDKTLVFDFYTRRQALAIKTALAAEQLARICDGPIPVAARVAKLGSELAADANFGLNPEILKLLAEQWQVPAASLTNVLEESLDYARKLRIGEAAVAAIRLLVRTEDKHLTVSSGSRPRPLVAAVDDAIEAVRLEAAAAVAEVGFDRDFAGSSVVRRRWAEMARMPNQLQALVIEPRESVAREWLVWLESLGYQVTWTQTGWLALEAIESASGFDFVVLSSRPSDSGPIEMIDRIRRYPKGGALPILVIGPPPQDRGMGLQEYVDLRKPALWVNSITSQQQLMLIHDDFFGNPLSSSFDAKVLLVGANKEDVARLTPLFSQIGYNVDSVSLAADAIKKLGLPNSVELIVAASPLPDQSVYAFSAQLRTNPRSVVTPLLVYGPSPFQPPLEIPFNETWDAPTAWVSRVDSLAGLADWRERLQQQETTFSVESLDRERLREVATKSLATGR